MKLYESQNESHSHLEMKFKSSESKLNLKVDKLVVDLQE